MKKIIEAIKSLFAKKVQPMPKKSKESNLKKKKYEA